MITDEQFRKTEGRLYRYYYQLRQIDKLKHKVCVLWKQKEQIEKDIKETNVNIEPDLNMGIDYSSERVQTSPTGASIAEKEVVKEIEKLSREWQRTKNKILKLNSTIREYEKQAADMEYVIGLLREDTKQFVELKYGSTRKLTNIKIGEILHIAEPTVRRRREDIVNDIAKWIGNF